MSSNRVPPLSVTTHPQVPPLSVRSPSLHNTEGGNSEAEAQGCAEGWNSTHRRGDHDG